MRSRILSEAARAMEKTINAQAEKPSVWRIIMKSKISKFTTVAAVVVLAVLLGIKIFGIMLYGEILFMLWVVLRGAKLPKAES